MAGLAAAAVLVAAAAVVLSRDGGGEPESSVRPRLLRTSGTLAPRILLFGDTLRARVDVTLDRRRVDPGSVAIRAQFQAWARAGKPTVERSDSGALSHLRTTFVLRCVRQACVPGRDTLPFQFEPARVTYTQRTARGRKIQRTARVAWPRLILHSRIAPNDLATINPWRTDLLTMPAPSYRASPGLVLALLATGTLLLGAAGVLLAYLGRPRRAPEPEPEPEPEPVEVVTPLERALELLETAAGPNGSADQRRSLELVAEVLAERGHDDEHARAARELAWSPTPPPVEATRGLAARVRATLEEELAALAAEREAEAAERERQRELDEQPA